VDGETEGERDGGNMIQPNTMGFAELVKRVEGSQEMRSTARKNLDYALIISKSFYSVLASVAVLLGMLSFFVGSEMRTTAAVALIARFT
jgi:hypothetical protein